MMPQNNDVIGTACLDFLAGQRNGKIRVKSNIAEDDFIPVPYLFRGYNDMPPLEQEALKLCKGAVLDIGCGAGAHSLWLMQNGFEVTSLEISEGACEAMRRRGLTNVIQGDFFGFATETRFDTLLMMMNGIGLIGEVGQLPLFFEKARNLLNPDGQIILDSSDIAYLFDDPETEHLPETFEHYYGEIEYQMSYKQLKGNWFRWLFIDPKLLTHLAKQHGWHCQIVKNGENGEFLALLKRL
jgi:2-polyprenyl-3-methyl-5-hydroxy-6-metoxy-1,4-benzoquinol methylase